MPPKKTKFVTVQLSSERLSGFTDLPTNLHNKPKRAKPQTKINKIGKVKGNSQDIHIGPEEIHGKHSQSANMQDGVGVGSGTNGSVNATSTGNGVENGSASPAVLTNNSNLPSNLGTGSKLSSNVRVGISGLTMNTSIVRELDKSGRRVSNWAKYDHVKEIQTDVNVPNGELMDQKPIAEEIAINLGLPVSVIADSTPSNSIALEATSANNDDIAVVSVDQKEMNKKSRISLNELETSHGVISLRDISGFKEHENKNQQAQLVEYARSKGRRVVRGFSGYLMLWPSWHKVKEGELGEIGKSQSVSTPTPIGDKDVKILKDGNSVKDSKDLKDITNVNGLENKKKLNESNVSKEMSDLKVEA